MCEVNKGHVGGVGGCVPSMGGGGQIGAVVKRSLEFDYAPCNGRAGDDGPRCVELQLRVMSSSMFVATKFRRSAKSRGSRLPSIEWSGAWAGAYDLT
jgi:hypothetical protein